MGFAIALMFCCRLIELPFAFYQGFVLEHRYGLSNERLGQWVIGPGQGRRSRRDLRCAGRVDRLLDAAIESDVVVGGLGRHLRVAMVGLVQLAPVPAAAAVLSLQAARSAGARAPGCMALAERARTSSGRRLRVGAQRAHQEGQRGAHRHGADAADSDLRHTAGGVLGRRDRGGAGARALASRPSRSVARHGVAGRADHVGFLAAHLALSAWAAPLGLRGIDDPAGLPLLLLVRRATLACC